MNTSIQFSKGEIKMPKNEMERLMTGNGEDLPEFFSSLIDEAMEFSDAHCAPQGLYVIFDNLLFSHEEYSITIENQTFNVDKRVFVQLKKATSLAIFICTAGQEISNYAKQLMNEQDIIKGYLMDMAGSVLVEAAMDEVQAKLRSHMEASGLKITNRYSPGYCGWHVSEQQKLFSLIPAHLNPVKLSDSSLMTPIKSVSGFIGIGKDVNYRDYTCDVCNMTQCSYRKTRKEVKM